MATLKRQVAMEELLCLAKKLQPLLAVPKIDLLFFATYFLILVLKEADMPRTEYRQQENPSEKLLSEPQNACLSKTEISFSVSSFSSVLLFPSFK